MQDMKEEFKPKSWETIRLKFWNWKVQ
jgi:hypothetical protein